MPNQPPKVRDPWFDNAKMALVTLVVVGHSWTLLPHNVVNDQAYDFLYFWHVPALALFRVYVGGEQLEDLFRDPHWPMWYLSALFFWRLMPPVLRPLWGGLP